jgi:hypothetical protein
MAAFPTIWPTPDATTAIRLPGMRLALASSIVLGSPHSGLALAFLVVC